MSITIEGFVRQLARTELAVHAETFGAVEAAAVVVEREAKREIGHYQGAVKQFPRWPKLARRTLSEKRRFGYSPPDNPLKRTGEMRASIGHQTSATPVGAESEIGANGIVPVVQELGTKDGHVPARSFLGRAAARKEEQIIRRIGEAYIAALVGRDVAPKLIR